MREVVEGAASAHLDVAEGEQEAVGTGGTYVLDGSDCDTWAGEVSDYAEADIDGDGAYGYWGTVGQRQGDQNGDGIDDLVVVGTDYYSSYSGYSDVAAALFFGTSSGMSDGDAEDGDVIVQDSAGNGAYASVLSDVDFDGDGLDDLVYGDFWGPSTYRGYVYILGGAELSSGDYDLQDDSLGYVYGDANSDYLGWSIGGADVDGDGYGDLFIAAPGADDVASNAGCVYRVDGRAGLSGSASIGFAASAAICGTEADGYLGRNAAPQLADFDGDGTVDLAVSASGAGKVYVFFDVDSVSGTVDTSSADVMIAVSSPSQFGFSMVTGDFDADGMADLAVSAPDGTSFNSSPDEPGLVLIYLGDTLAAASSTLDETDALGAIDGEGSDLFGLAMAAGDLDGDGQDDLIVASPQYGSSLGRVYVFLVP